MSFRLGHGIARAARWMLLGALLALAGCANLNLPWREADDLERPRNIIILFGDGAAATQWEFGRYTSEVELTGALRLISEAAGRQADFAR